MKLRLALLLISVACCCSCSPSGSQRPANPGAAGQPDASAEQADGAADEQAADSEDPSKWDWQLPDDSAFIVRLEPWPPTAGPATIKAEATMDDGEQKFAGTVAYRLASSEQNSEPWLEMPRGSGDDEESVYFQAPITLGKGATYIQFRVQDAGDTQPADLLDWKVEAQ